MKKISKQSVYGMLATLTTLLAASVATSACYFFYYQPEEPSCLNDEA